MPVSSRQLSMENVFGPQIFPKFVRHASMQKTASGLVSPGRLPNGISLAISITEAPLSALKNILALILIASTSGESPKFFGQFLTKKSHLQEYFGYLPAVQSRFHLRDKNEVEVPMLFMQKTFCIEAL